MKNSKIQVRTSKDLKKFKVCKNEIVGLLMKLFNENEKSKEYTQFQFRNGVFAGGKNY